MTSSNVLKQYFFKLLDPNKPALSESTVCCSKCHQHGMIKRFHVNQENLQSDHLFEFHAIICSDTPEYILGTELLNDISGSPFERPVNSEEEEDETSKIQLFNDTDVVEVEFVQQAIKGEETCNGKEAPIIRHSGVWQYFEEQIHEQKVYCLVCREGNVIHSYSTNSSTSNLRKHLKSAHDIEVENYRPLMKKDKNEDKRGYGISRVWKYFCKVTKNGKIQERDFVYCAECLKLGVQHRYKQTSSTGTLKAHLRSIHEINIDSGREYTEQTTNINDEPVPISVAGLEASLVKSLVRRGKHKKLSSARAYFHDVIDDDEYIQCSPCLSENKTHKYRKSTSSSTLKTHLVQKHGIDPDSEENAVSMKEDEQVNSANNEDVFIRFEDSIQERAKKLTSIKTRKVRTYFFRINDEENFSCAFCIVNGIKKSYKPTTSTSGLRRHLMSTHQIDPLEYFQSNSNVVLNEEQIAESIAATNRAKESHVWKFFCRKEITDEDSNVVLDQDYVYCSICWNAPVRQIHKYRNTTSSGALKRHLAVRHGMNIENTRQRSLSKHQGLNDIEIEDDEEDEIEEEENDESQNVFIEEFNVTDEPIKIPSPQPLPPPKLIPKHCRSCGKQDAGFFTKLSAVFDDDTNEFEKPEQISLSDLYFEVTGIRVNPEDGLSQLICYLCEANLKSSYKFRKTALETEKAMLEKLGVDQEGSEQEIEMLDEDEDEYSEVQEIVVERKQKRKQSFNDYSNEKPSATKIARKEPRIIAIIPPKYTHVENRKVKNEIMDYENEEIYSEMEIEQDETLENVEIINSDSDSVLVETTSIDPDKCSLFTLPMKSSNVKSSQSTTRSTENKRKNLLKVLKGVKTE
uniref:CSON000097 protein n=1 Tax=Culicoides sonorensis TaxID=179676 RepID=A0A336LU81_CULSO